MSLPQRATQSKPYTLIANDILDSDPALDLTPGGYAALVDFLRVWQRESRNGRLNIRSIPFTHSRCRRRISRAAFDRARDELEGAGFIATVNRRWGHYRWTFGAARPGNKNAEKPSAHFGHLKQACRTGDDPPLLLGNVYNRRKKAPHRPKGSKKVPQNEVVKPKSTSESVAEEFGVAEDRKSSPQNEDLKADRDLSGGQDERPKTVLSPNDKTGGGDPPTVPHDQPLKRFARFPRTKTLPGIKTTKSRGSTRDPRVSRGPSSMAEILGGLTNDVMEIVVDIEAITGEHHWRRWWTATLREIAAAGCLGEFEGWVRYAADCQSPRQRALKDLGELKAPGPFLVSKALELQRRHGFKWHDYPGISPG